MRAEKAPLLRKLKTVRGQLEGVMKMMEEDRYCIDISNQLMASISILKNINKEVLEGHMRGCIKDALASSDEEELEKKIEELNHVIAKLSK